MRSRTLRIRTTMAALLAVTLIGVPGAGRATDEPFCDPVSTTAPNCYVQMDDGVLIALSIKIPSWCSEASKCPTIFEMSGYDGGSADPETGETMSGEIFGPWFDQCNAYFDDQCGGPPLAEDSRQLTKVFNDGAVEDYAVIHASVRGTGCSGGDFDLFSVRTAEDGASIIEWIAAQPWSNEKVGIMGHSYGGITGFMVAAEQGRLAKEGKSHHLVSATLSGLVDDLYRGITYMGGVSNFGFPLLWTGGVRPAYDIGGGKLAGLTRPITRPVLATGDGDPAQTQTCAANIASQKRTVLDDPIVQGAVTDTDSDWWRVRALMSYAPLIDVPIHITGAYQDEQTGPRGPAHLWELVGGVPKRLLLSNGDHGTNQGAKAMADRKKWMDHWMRGVDNGYGTLAQEGTSVTVWLETHGNTANETIEDTTFPLSTTQWTPLYLRAGGALSGTLPGASETPDVYASGSGRQSWSFQAGYDAGPPLTTADGPDEVTYSYPVGGSSLTIAGPIMANLYVAGSAPDTEMFVQLIDQAPDGSRTYLQRGMLKASHNAIDLLRSDCVGAGNAHVPCGDLSGGQILYRPHRPHTNPILITPGKVNLYRIEVFPVGHVFRPGHTIMVKVMSPPAVDSYYMYVPKTARGVNAIVHDVDHPSSILLPVVTTPNTLGAAIDCGGQDAVRCVAKPNGQ